MPDSNRPIEGSLTNKSRKSGWTVFWLVLVVIAFIGQTAALYIPAFVGISPADGDPMQAPSRVLGALLWPTLLGVLLQKLRGKRKLIGALYGLINGFLIYGGAFFVAAQYSSEGTDDANGASIATESGGQTSAWIESELTEDYMRRRTKDECMLKTVDFLKSCDSQNCLTAMAGAMGDCVTWAEGDFSRFCESFEQRYMTQNCTTGELSERACGLLDKARFILCEGQ